MKQSGRRRSHLPFSLSGVCARLPRGDLVQQNADAGMLERLKMVLGQLMRNRVFGCLMDFDEPGHKPDR